MDWQSKLKGMRSELPPAKQPEKPAKQSKVEKTEVQKAERVVAKPHVPTAAEYEARERMARREIENDPDFQDLWKELGIRPASDDYFQLMHAVRRTKGTADTFRLRKFTASSLFSGGDRRRIDAIVEKFVRLGAAENAFFEWRNTQPGHEHVGRGTKEEKLARAEEWARRAGLPLDQIIRERRK